jgi:lipoprotein-anchoring transpeptidase ErfK/SrfK
MVKPQVVEIDLATLTPQEPEKVKEVVAVVAPTAAQPQATPASAPTPIAECDRVHLLFQKDSPLPIVETIQYKSKVSWKSGRSAWLVDYAAHYKTPLHFIARSMNGRADYNAKPAAEGQIFNVLSQNVNFYFYLLIDIARCKMDLYAMLPDSQERIQLKTYRVGLGRVDSTRASGSLTPIGKYSLGSRVAIYQPKIMGNYRGKRTEMITVFGTRWIPFEKELSNCSEPAKGLGIHGTPWQDGVDNTSSIGRYESDGCIRLRAQDIEELYAIITTRQAVVEIVNDSSKLILPGKEKIL